MITAPKPTNGVPHRAPDARARAARAEAPVRLAPTAPRRQYPMVALGVLLILGSALVFAVASVNIGNRQAVLAVSTAVPAGQTISASDLAVVHVSLDPGISPVAAADESSVIGRPAAVALSPGSLLTRQQVGTPSGLSGDQAVVGLALKDGQFPPTIAAGVHVLVVDTPSVALAGGAGQTATVATYPGVVLTVGHPAVTSAATTVLTVRLGSSGDAATVAAAAAAGHVAVVQVAATQ